MYHIYDIECERCKRVFVGGGDTRDKARMEAADLLQRHWKELVCEGGKSVMEKVAVVGSRSFTNKEYAFGVLDKLRSFLGDFQVVTGGAEGADLLGALWANDRKLPTPIVFPAFWDDLSNPDAVIKTRRNGTKYDAIAGIRRNTQVVDAATIVVAFMDVDNPTPGTSDTIEKAKKKGIPVFIYYPTQVMLAYNVKEQ